MSLKSAALLLCPLGASAAGAELQQAARNLAVTVEPLDGATAVNGLPITMTRVVGRNVPELAQELMKRWRGQSGEDSVKTVHCCGWTFASRIRSGTSNVIQWRASPEGGELLWSELRVSGSAPSAPVPSLPLSVLCDWTAPVHGQVAGRRFLQIAARCRRDPTTALESMIPNLSSHGWKWRRGGLLILQAQRGPVQLQLLASPALPLPGAASVAGSSLVLLETWPVDAVHP